MMRTCIVALGLVFCLSRAGSAGQPGSANDQCGALPSTAAMRKCEDARYTKLQGELQTVYTRLLGQLSPPARQKLAAAESAWTSFRGANAEFQASTADGGTMAPLLRSTTLADMTQARVVELRKILH